MPEQTPDEFFSGHPLGMATYDRTCRLAAGLGPFEVRVSRTQVAFRRRTGFALHWAG